MFTFAYIKLFSLLILLFIIMMKKRVLYDGHKKVHSIKFQSVAAPNGLIANLYGHAEGRRHDNSMLARSRLLDDLQQHSHDPNGNILCIFGDPAYPLRPHLQTPFKGANVTPLQKQWNKSMSQVLVSVEWILDFKRILKVHLSAVDKMYIVYALLQNARSCLYGSTTSEYFGICPPQLEDYLFEESIFTVFFIYNKNTTITDLKASLSFLCKLP